jgi:hypothetical protein
MRRTIRIDGRTRSSQVDRIGPGAFGRATVPIALIGLWIGGWAAAAPWDPPTPAVSDAAEDQTRPLLPAGDEVEISDDDTAHGRPGGPVLSSAIVPGSGDSGDAPGVLQTLYESLGMDEWIGGEGDDRGQVEPAGHETFGGFFQPYDACGRGHCPKWRGTVDALLLWQGNLASRPLYRNFDGFSVGGTALDANELMPSLSAGPRYGILYQFDPCWSVEGNYFRVTPFDSERVVSGDPELAEVDIVGFNDEGFDQVGAFGWGEVQSAECNLRHRHCQSPTTWIAGFRWVQLDQNLLIQEDGFLGDPDFFADFLTRTGNDLYGGQVGFDTMVWNDCSGPLQINVLGKAGVFANIAYQSILYEDSDGDFAELDESTTATSFFGEFGVNATYRLTNWLGWRAGYTLFWASGIATPVGQLAANNLDSGVARINTAGSVLLHGVTTGVEARW